ncbi:MAG: PD-(D/E)XK nuclease family protein, partial [bacterium]
METKISFSKIITFMECPRKYWFKYVFGIEPVVPLTMDKAFGKAFHAAYIEVMKTGSVESAMSKFDEVYDFPVPLETGMSPKNRGN